MSTLARAASAFLALSFIVATAALGEPLRASSCFVPPSLGTLSTTGTVVSLRFVDRGSGPAPAGLTLANAAGEVDLECSQGWRADCAVARVGDVVSVRAETVATEGGYVFSVRSVSGSSFGDSAPCGG